jgi:hypothetical protein
MLLCHRPGILRYPTLTSIAAVSGILFCHEIHLEYQTPGSALGIEEFKINLQRIKDGLSRTKETAELREEIEKQSQQKPKTNRRA